MIFSIFFINTFVKLSVVDICFRSEIITVTKYNYFIVNGLLAFKFVKIY